MYYVALTIAIRMQKLFSFCVTLPLAWICSWSQMSLKCGRAAVLGIFMCTDALMVVPKLEGQKVR